MIRVSPELPVVILRACFDEAERAYPRESCGLLSGPKVGGVIDAVRICENDQDRLHAKDPVEFAQDGRTAYRLPFVEVCWLLDSLATDQPVQIVFHSHVEVGADFSSEDRAAALGFGPPFGQIDHLVIDVGKAGVRGAVLYRFTAGEFVRAAEYDEAGQTRAVSDVSTWKQNDY